MKLQRVPRPALRPFVKLVWLVDERAEPRSSAVEREHVLPTGATHLVFRLSGDAVRVFTGLSDPAGRAYGSAVVGGARATYYAKDVIGPSFSIGAQLQPGASLPLFGAHAGELAGSHCRLDELWGRSAALARERLMDERDALRRLDLFESILMARLPQIRGLHPVVALALERFTRVADVREVVAESGYSHRRFIALFHEAVGLTPKLYCRLQRFQRTLARMTVVPHHAWVDLALEAGYSDQSHFNREFSEFAGITPGEYRKIAPSNANHIPVRNPLRHEPKGQAASMGARHGHAEVIR
jgi:AraC-like DNA-binding protein